MNREEALKILNQETLTTHELAEALLALDNAQIDVEDHTMIWSKDLDEGIQVGLHRY